MDNTTSLGYSGHLTVTIQKKKYKFKNNGYIGLFELFSRLLAKELIDLDDLPAQIDIVDGEEESILSKTVGISSSQSIKYSDDAGEHAITRLRFHLTDGNFSASVETINSGKYTVKLYDGKQIDPTLLASLEIDVSTLQQISTGREALFEWDLEVANKSNKRGNL